MDLIKGKFTGKPLMIFMGKHRWFPVKIFPTTNPLIFVFYSIFCNQCNWSLRCSSSIFIQTLPWWRRCARVTATRLRRNCWSYVLPKLQVSRWDPELPKMTGFVVGCYVFHAVNYNFIASFSLKCIQKSDELQGGWSDCASGIQSWYELFRCSRSVRSRRCWSLFIKTCLSCLNLRC